MARGGSWLWMVTGHQGSWVTGDMWPLEEEWWYANAEQTRRDPAPGGVTFHISASQGVHWSLLGMMCSMSGSWASHIWCSSDHVTTPWSAPAHSQSRPNPQSWYFNPFIILVNECEWMVAKKTLRGDDPIIAVIMMSTRMIRSHQDSHLLPPPPGSAQYIIAGRDCPWSIIG